jgi:hypothetical protein
MWLFKKIVSYFSYVMNIYNKDIEEGIEEDVILYDIKIPDVYITQEELDKVV